MVTTWRVGTTGCATPFSLSEWAVCGRKFMMWLDAANATAYVHKMPDPFLQAFVQAVNNLRPTTPIEGDGQSAGSGNVTEREYTPTLSFGLVHLSLLSAVAHSSSADVAGESSMHCESSPEFLVAGELGHSLNSSSDESVPCGTIAGYHAGEVVGRVCDRDTTSTESGK